MWCKRVGGDRGLIRTYDKRKGQRESNLIWSKSRTEAKRGKKGSVQETVPGRETERVEDRNAVQGCWVVEGTCCTSNGAQGPLGTQKVPAAQPST